MTTTRKALPLIYGNDLGAARIARTGEMRNMGVVGKLRFITPSN
jgi:hypothetical protein